MAKQDDYFLKRAIADEEKMHRALDKPEQKIINAYNKAQDYLNKQIQKTYKRYLYRSNLTEQEVQTILNTTAPHGELVELQQMAGTISDPAIKDQVANYLTGLAVKSRITRLEDLKAKSYIVSKQIANVQLDVSTDFYIDTIKEAHDQAATEAIAKRFVSTKKGQKFEIRDAETDKVIKTVNLTTDKVIPEFKELSTKYVKNILESDWKGSNYSKRIWHDTDLLAERLEELFTVKQLTGMSETEMTKVIAKEFNTAKYVARRLVRTESNYMAGQAKLKGWKAHGVTQYILIAVLDFRTSKICRSIDGKIFKIDDVQVGINFPPMHVFCRTVPAAYFGERTLNGTRTANDPLTGKTFTINQRDNYKAWEQMLIKKHSKLEVDAFRLKVKNLKVDTDQFKRYKSVLGDQLTYKTIGDFQTMKYLDKATYNKLKKLYAKTRGR